MWKIVKDDDDSIKMIQMTIGDTPSFKIDCLVSDADGNTESYVPETEDEFIFACKKKKSDEEYLFKIAIPNDTMTLTFAEDDTKGLAAGKYFFEISLNKPSTGYHCTFIESKILKLTEEMY